MRDINAYDEKKIVIKYISTKCMTDFIFCYSNIIYS